MTTVEAASDTEAGQDPPTADTAPMIAASPPPPAARAWWAVLCAVGAGGALLLAFPPFALWWLAPVGVALLAVAVHRRRLRTGFGLGMLSGLVLFVPLLSWTQIVGGLVPWLLLAVLEAAFVGLVGAAGAWVAPLADRYRWAWPLVTGLLWVGQEALRDRVPFGGFPWGRLAFSQPDSPVLRLAVLGGAPLVTFAVALAGGLLALAGWRLAAWGFAGSRRAAVSTLGWRPVAAMAAPLLGAALVVLAGLAIPLSRPSGPAVTVAVVQGNVPRMGLEFNAQRRAVLDNHVTATLDLAQRVAAGQAPRPDLVVWPENSSDIDPLIPDDADARAQINRAADAIGVPILVGTLLEGPGYHLRNVSIVWKPGSGPQSPIYVKQHPVPFAEYIPLRSVARMVTDKVDLVRNDFVPGDRPGVLDTGPATVADAICFEVAYDNLVRSGVTGGGQLITVQTNNADFNTAEARQQLAMVQLRAIEHGRDGLMASTVGVSAFVTADGRVLDATRLNTRAVLVRQLHLGQGRTLATAIGPLPEYVLAGLAFAVLVVTGIIRRNVRTNRRNSER
jgi:apolipoprotein N-acyltransferase